MNFLDVVEFPFCFPLNSLKASFPRGRSRPKRITALIEVVHQLLVLRPVQIRIAGSTARALMSDDPLAALTALSESSDIDIHVIVERLELSTNPLPFGLSKLQEKISEADILASKVMVGSYTVSVHLYSTKTFLRMCSMEIQHFKMVRNTSKTQSFICTGFSGMIENHWQSTEQTYGYSVDIHQDPIITGKVYVFPYQHVAITGIDVLQSQKIQEARHSLLHAIVKAATNDGCPDGNTFTELFHYAKRPNPPLLQRHLAAYF